MSNTPEPKEVELVCGCCGRRDNVNPTTARYWPECCGRRMDRHTDASETYETRHKKKDRHGIDWDDPLTLVRIQEVNKLIREEWSKTWPAEIAD